MGYQALLFCPDEKVARAVTQVLSELDFTVIPCTEPFGAVKKLMGEHFDAVVVDCDNEQNATLLFKSARNTPANQSSLAVAVVEGQAGVAKAFRIGANLVLTKPINVEQAKGTLRVARGLLRKNEAGKPAATTAPTVAVKPVKPAPAPPKPVSPAPNSRVVTARPAAPVTPLVNAATASIPTQKPAQPKVVASIPTEINESDADILEISDEVASPSIASSPIVSPSIVSSSISGPEAKIAAAQPANVSSVSASGVGSGAASAPAPARETKSSITTDIKSPTSAPESSVGKVADFSVETSSGDGASVPAPAFTFGGNVSDDDKPASGGSKKTLLIVAAVLLIAAGGYAIWMQWVGSSGAATPFTKVAGPVVKTPAVIPPVAPRVASAASSAATSSATAPSSVPSSTPDTVASRPAGAAKTSSNSDASDEDDAEKTPAHSGKLNPKANSAKVSAPAVDKAPETIADAPAIVIKNDLSQKPVAKRAATPDAVAPSITGIAAGDGGALPNLMGGESNAPAPMLGTLNVSQGVSRGLLVKKTAPVYPASALQMHIEGAVELVATISKSGDISAVKVASGNPQLARAAVDAVKQWKYKPYLLNGEPVEIQTQVTVNFKLPN